MSKFLWHIAKVAPAVLGASLIATQGAIAFPNPELSLETQPATVSSDEALSVLKNRPQLQRPGSDRAVASENMSQVTSVSELRDVEPTAWAYEALRSLVERYGCIVGYPDRTFRGDRALSRWEFAAGLNACINVIERLLQENVAVLREDIDKLKRLAQEFESELAALGARIDNLETRVSFLEDHQFSTTTKLKGEVIFSIADAFGDRAGSNRNTSQVAFNDRIRLNLETSFTGKDLLKTRLQAGNFNSTFNARGVTGTNQTRLAYDNGSSNNLEIDDLFYRFPIGSQITAWVGANGLDLDDVFDPVSPFFASSGTGALSRLQRYNGMVTRGPEGTGAALKFKFNKEFYITGTYLADKGVASDPTEGKGLFNGSFSTGAQIGYSGDSLQVAFAYVHSYRTAGSAGLFGNVSSPSAEIPFGSGVPTTADRFGLSANWRVAKWINLGAWGGYASASEQSPSISRDSVDIWTWNANVSFPDLGKEGAVLSLGGGLPPKGNVSDSSYIIEAQYKYPLTKNILLTPGFYVVLNPNDNADNEAIWIGVLRTTFTF